MVTLLPQPLSPTMPKTWPGMDVERHPIDRLDDAFVHEEVGLSDSGLTAKDQSFGSCVNSVDPSSLAQL